MLCTLRMKRLVNMWIAAAVILLISIGATAAQPKRIMVLIRMARISRPGPHGAGRSAMN